MHGYFNIDDLYHIDFETTHFSNNVNEMWEYLTLYDNDNEYGVELKHLYDFAKSRGLNTENYVVYCGDEIIMIFDKSGCFKSNVDGKFTTLIYLDFSAWINETFNEYNVKLINVLMGNNNI